MALIGTTITPYMQFYVASAVVDKGVRPANYASERVDTVSGAIWSDIVSIFIIIATAAAIGGTGPLQSAEQAAKALEPVVGSAAPDSFRVSGCSGRRYWRRRWSRYRPLTPSPTLWAGPGRSPTASGRPRCFTDSSRCRSSSVPASPWRPATWSSLVVNAQVLNGVITPLLLTYVLILANRRSVLGSAVNGRRFSVVATVSVGGDRSALLRCPPPDRGWALTAS